MKTFLFACIILLLVNVSHAQTAPFQNEIDQFKKEDSTHTPPANAILFIGSSSFRMWTDVQSYFPGYPIINRGFGGSQLSDVIHFAPDIIYPYHPKQIVIYCGDNDLAADTSQSGKDVSERFQTLYQLIRKNLGKKVNIAFVSIKPSPSRTSLLPKMIVANALIEQYLSKEKNTAFIDVFHPMLDASGSMRPELYKDDMLHMKPEGYIIWQKAIAPFLLK